MYYVIVTILSVEDTTGEKMEMSVLSCSLLSRGKTGYFIFDLLDLLFPFLHPALNPILNQCSSLLFGFQKCLNTERHHQRMKRYKENEVMVFSSSVYSSFC